MELTSTAPSIVEFCGASSGTFELTWGQKQMCEWMQNAAPHIEHMNMAVSIECTEPTTLEDIRYALRVLIERHEALRTRINFHEDGRYVQLVCAAGKIPLTIRRCAGWEDSWTVLQDLTSVPFTVFEWPLRIAVVTAGEGEAVSGIVMGLSHVMTDGWGLDVITRDLHEFLSATPDQRRVLAERSPRPLVQPREHAAAQRDAVGGKSDIRAEKFWTSQFARFPNDRFPVPLRTPETLRFPKFTMESRAGARALSEAAARCDVTVSAVLMGALSVLLSAISDQEEATFRLFCANRITEESRNSVGSLVQTVPVAMRVSGLPFREIAFAAWKASLGAYRVGERDPDRISWLEESVITARGVDPDLECFVNIYGENEFDRRPIESPSDAAEAPTEFRKNGGIEDWEAGKFYVGVWRVSGCLEVSLSADTALFSHDQIVGFLQCLETILLSVADHPDLRPEELVGDAGCIAEIQRVAGLVRVDGCWVDLDEVHRVLADVCSPRAAQIFLKKDAEGTSLVAYLVLEQSDCGPRDVHRALLAEIKTRRFVMTPHWYVICRSEPEDPASEEEWRLRDVISEGTGR